MSNKQITIGVNFDENGKARGIVRFPRQVLYYNMNADNSVIKAVAGGVASGTAYTTMTAQNDVPRNVQIEDTVDNRNPLVTLTVVGYDQYGDSQTEVIGPCGATGNTTPVQGSVAFSWIVSITTGGAATAGLGGVSLNCGSKIGVPGPLTASTDLKCVAINQAIQLYSDFTVDTTYDTILLATLVVAADDYQIWWFG